MTKQQWPPPPIDPRDPHSPAVIKLAGLYRRAYAGMPVVAVTGSCGKSTACALITALLATRGRVSKSVELPDMSRGFTDSGMADRVSIESGSFFESVPKGHDAYILSHIIHDWNVEQCHTILRHCRDAIPC